MAQNFCRMTGGVQERLMIIGAGDTGTELARRLVDGWDLTLLDVDLSGARAELERDGLAPSIRMVEADATSRLQLEKAGLAQMDTVVLTTAPDEVTLEVATIVTRDFDKSHVWALVRHTEARSGYEALGVHFIHDYEAVAASLMSRVSRGSRVASDVGLGRGEIIETQILPNSSVIDKPLSMLNPQRWLVAAIYRDEALVVPHGDTVLKGGDRVVLVGEPRILPCIARFLRTGHSEFPLHYGSGLIVPLLEDPDPVIPEVEYLLQATRAEFAEFITEAPRSLDAAALRQQFRYPSVDVRTSHVTALAGTNLEEALAGRDTGIVFQNPVELRLSERIGLRRDPLVKRFEDLRVPVIITRRSHPYKRIMLAIPQPDLDVDATILAIDTARMLSASLTVAAAFPPDFVAGAGFGPDLQKAMENALELASSYGVRVDLLHLEGNPVKALLKAARDFELLVVGMTQAHKGRLLRPGVVKSLIHRAPCSVMVLPH